MCKKFTVIGLTDGRKPFFPPEVLEAIAAASVFSGGRRHHEIVEHILPPGAQWIEITVPLEAVFEQYAAHREVVVFASGDPLFYGFAGTLRRRLPEAEIKVYPAPNSLQMLAHRMCLPYEQMHCVSLTGRPWDAFDKALITGESLIGALTDRHKTPAMIASRMLGYSYDNYRMTVGEALGNEAEERVRSFTLKEASETEFTFPNCLILERLREKPRPFGIPESEFELLDGRAKMITKMPIRLLTLQALELRRRHSFWDIGFCTGSVSIEARLQFPDLQITAFEVREAGRQLMEANSRRFGAPGINAVIGDFLSAGLDSLPAPDAVFIGGHGGKLKEMLRRIDEVLLPGGAIVFNSVSPESKAQFEEGIEALGRHITGRTHVAIDDFNPIDILRAE